MQFDGTTKLHRKSGFGLHQLRNRYRGRSMRLTLFRTSLSGKPILLYRFIQQVSILADPIAPVNVCGSERAYF
jgi:hypothetical protein